MESLGSTAASHSRKRKHGKFRPNVQELIRAALEETNGNENAAVALLVDQALEDVDYIREIFSLAVQALNRHNRSSERSSVRRAVQTAGTTVRSLGTALARPLLEFPLQDGTFLKDAYQPQIERAIAQFGHQGRTMLHLARWLESIHAKITPTQAVGEVLDEFSIRQLYDETQD